jgi:hypothetical protein
VRVINGYLEDGRFTPQEYIKLPKRVQVVLVYNDTAVDEDNTERMDLLKNFHRMAAESASENDVFKDTAFIYRPSGRELLVFSDEADL